MPKPAPRAGVKRALDQKQLTLFYQPIHELESRRIICAEALLRARRRTGEIRNAGSIATGAEETPDLFRLDSWLVRQALTDATHWQTNAAPGVQLNVNLSPREFEEGNAHRRLMKLLTQAGVDPHTINVEITEIAYIERPKQTMRILEALASHGVGLWLDDFGTGHTSISHLLHFPLAGLKLPGDFVKLTPGNQRAVAIVGHLIALAHDLGMKVIAEGVENPNQLKMLLDMRCDFVQGFLFSRPMPLDRLEAELTRSSAASPLPDSKSRGGGRGRGGRSS